MPAVTTTIIAIEAASALITLAINGLVAAQKYQTLIVQARAEDREISTEELDALRQESIAITDDVIKLLQAE